MNRRIATFIGAGLIIAAALLLIIYGPREHPELWFTADQQGDRLLHARQYAEAAKIYADPFRRGIALYRAGDFQSAVSAFSQTATPEAAFNRANALVMLGKYDDAESLRSRTGTSS
jgi:Ca-activated chloride channel family protein